MTHHRLAAALRLVPGLRLALSLLLGLLLAGCAFVPTSPDVRYTVVTIRVQYADGVPVPGMRVEAWGGWRRTGRRNVETTDESGEVRFSLPPALYDVRAYPPAGLTGVSPVPILGQVYADPSLPPPSVVMTLVRSS